MKSLFVALLLVTLVHVSIQMGAFTLHSVRVTPIDHDEDGIPVNPVAKQCGGAGKLIHQRNSYCKNASEMACHPLGSSQEDAIMETQFEPSKDFQALAWRTWVMPDGKEAFVDHDIIVPDSMVKKGNLTQLQAIVKNRGAGRGSKYGAKFEIYDPSDKSVELCVQGRFEYV